MVDIDENAPPNPENTNSTDLDIFSLIEEMKEYSSTSTQPVVQQAPSKTVIKKNPVAPSSTIAAKASISTSSSSLLQPISTNRPLPHLYTMPFERPEKLKDGEETTLKQVLHAYKKELKRRCSEMPDFVKLEAVSLCIILSLRITFEFSYSNTFTSREY